MALYSNKPTHTRLTLAAFEIACLFWLISFSLLLCQQELKDYSKLLIGYSPVITFVWFRFFFPRLLNHKSGLIVSVIHLTIASVAYLVLTTTRLDHVIGWYTLVHILLALLSITAFALSGVSSILYLVQEKAIKSKRISHQMLKRTPSLSQLDRICLKGTLIGFPCYSISIFLGIAQVYIHRQDLQVSHLIAAFSWLLFGILLQARLVMGWRGKRAAILNIVAFTGLLVVLIDYGVRAYVRSSV